MKKILALILVLTVIFCTLPFGIFTAIAETIRITSLNGSTIYYFIENCEANITDCDISMSGEVTIPSTLGGYPVTSIDYRAFDDCTSLTSIIIPDSVTSIGSSAFNDCSSLTSIIIPDSVTSIGSSAFDGCNSLTSITIPDGVTSIGEEVFRGCNSLTSITVDSENQNFSSQDGVLFYKDKTKLITYPASKAQTSYTIPISVISIGVSAFRGCSALTSITIPNSVTNIDNFAFENCNSLTEVTIPDSVTSIGDWAFYNCSLLTSITLSDNVTHIGDDVFYGTKYYNNSSNWENDVLYIDNYLIDAKTSLLGKYTIKKGTKTIACSAFYSCSSLTSITIPNSVTSIDYNTFTECGSLTSITIPDSVTFINFYAFCGCSSLTSITIPSSVTSINHSTFSGCTSLISITLPESVTNIGDFAFEECSSLTSITIPDSITNIGDFVFYGCSLLETVYYKGTEEQWNKISIGFDNENLINAEIVFNYKELSPEMSSDLDGDGKITSADVNLIRDVVLGDGEITEEQQKAYDVNGDGTFDILDYIHIKKLYQEALDTKSDINGDGAINSSDVVLMKKAVLNITELTEEDTKAYDLNGDNKFNVLDLIRIKKLLADV